jgi:hypothetical protein
LREIKGAKACCRYVLCRTRKRNTRSRTRGNSVHTLLMNYCTITSTKSFICKSCTVQLGQVETRKNALKNFCRKHFCSNSRLAYPRSDCTSLSCIFAIVSFYCTIVPPSSPLINTENIAGDSGCFR